MHLQLVYFLFTSCSLYVNRLFTVFTHRADLLPLPVQFCLLVGLFEAPGLPALRHLDAVLEGGPAGTNSVITPSRHSLSVSTQGLTPTLAEPPCCSCNLNTPPGCRSPSVPTDPFCFPETEHSFTSCTVLQNKVVEQQTSS